MKQYPTRAQAVADFLRKEILSGELDRVRRWLADRFRDTG